MTVTRGTTNRNARGSSLSRKIRKLWLLAEFGDGTEAPCSFCGVTLDFTTITVDRIIPGCRGGTYRRGNIRPACARCNSVNGGALRRDPDVVGAEAQAVHEGRVQLPEEGQPPALV